jgi:hypothetical protein
VRCCAPSEHWISTGEFKRVTSRGNTDGANAAWDACALTASVIVWIMTTRSSAGTGVIPICKMDQVDHPLHHLSRV